MSHTIYDNFVLENKIEDMLTTAVDMNAYMTADYSLAEEAGMVKKIHKYKATGDVEELAMGEGNDSTNDITVTFAEEAYTVGTTQGHFTYYDEEEMTDPMVVDVGLKGLAAKMTNNLTSKAITEFGKASLIFYGAQWKFDDITDAIAMYPYESEDGLFLLINPAEKAAFRKLLKEYLTRTEGFTRTGYIGTVCNVPVIVSKAVPAGKAFLADRKAVTCFIKKGSEVEQQRDPDHRKNDVWGRKVMLVALTDATRVIKLTANSDPRTGKTLVAAKPDDWDSKYNTDYYFYDEVNETCELNTESDWDKVAGKIYE